jgi:hypothetical protein
METYKVKFQNDHFIEVDKNDVISPVNGKEYFIIGEEGTFEVNKQKNTIGKSLESLAKRDSLIKRHKNSVIQKIINSGTKLYFRTSKPGGDGNQEYIFQCELLEDQYLYLLEGRDGNEPESWRLTKCNCQLEKCLNEELQVYQKLKADSLNSLYTKTVMHFFSEKLSGSTNAMTTFFIHDKEEEIKWYDALKERYLTVNKIRIRVAEFYPKKYTVVG